MSYFYETLLEACTMLYSEDVVQACNLINYLFWGEEWGIGNELERTSKAFEQWLYLYLTAVQEDDKELKQSTLERLASEFVSSSNDTCRVRCLCVLEKWSTSNKIESDELQKLLKELQGLGFDLGYQPCSLEVGGIVLKDSPMEMKDPNICPYERQIILEEMLLALGSGAI
jgi:hypothetical protein